MGKPVFDKAHLAHCLKHLATVVAAGLHDDH